MRTAQIDINSQNLAHNVSTLKHQTQAKLLAMVKADAYGHGIANIVPHLDSDGFGVACLAEALAVKAQLAPTDPRPIVLIEGVFDDGEWQQAIAQQLMVVIHNDAQVSWACQHTPPSSSHTNTIWLKYNTGMNRLGFDDIALMVAAQRLIEAGYRLILTSHFACADDHNNPMNAVQIARFDTMYQQLSQKLAQKLGGGIERSLCNSAGLFNYPKHHYDWVRVGIALYGGSPLINKTRDQLNLKAVMTLFAKLMAIHTLDSGQAVGYGGTWVARRPSRIGIVSIGYGDGYPRTVEHAYVSINGQRLPIVGRVAMDMLAVDITDSSAMLGDTVILWGQMPSLDEVAHFAHTISYELMCRLTQRPTRVVHQ